MWYLIDFDLQVQRELATISYRQSPRCRTEARYHTISYDQTVDQPHEFLRCFFFLARVVVTKETKENNNRNK